MTAGGWRPARRTRLVDSTSTCRGARCAGRRGAPRRGHLAPALPPPASPIVARPVRSTRCRARPSPLSRSPRRRPAREHVARAPVHHSRRAPPPGPSPGSTPRQPQRTARVHTREAAAKRFRAPPRVRHSQGIARACRRRPRDRRGALPRQLTASKTSPSPSTAAPRPPPPRPRSLHPASPSARRREGVLPAPGDRAADSERVERRFGQPRVGVERSRRQPSRADEGQPGRGRARSWRTFRRPQTWAREAVAQAGCDPGGRSLGGIGSPGSASATVSTAPPPMTTGEG